MDLQYFGGNCIVVSQKGVRLVVDDTLNDLGVKSVLRADDIVVYSAAHALPDVPAKLVIDHPGEYEVSDISIIGIPARAHIDEDSKKTATIYKIFTTEFSLLFMGHVYPELSDEQLESIGMVDVMFVPVGGNGYTLDPLGALKLIKAVEPKLVIPTNYNDPALNYPVPQQELGEALKTLGMEPRETTTRLKLKPAELSDVTQLVVLERA